MKLVAEWIYRAFVLLLTTYIIPGFKIDSFTTAMVVAAVIAVLNILIKPLLVILTLPITVFTLGLFMLVINAILLVITANIVRGFRIDSFVTAIIASIVITLVTSLLNVVMR